MADVLTLVASKRELLRADDRLRPDRHHREPQLPIRSIVTDLIESWDPVLPLAIPDESLGPPFKRIRRADRVAQRECSSTPQRERDAEIVINPVIALGSV